MAINFARAGEEKATRITETHPRGLFGLPAPSAARLVASSSRSAGAMLLRLVALAAAVGAMNPFTRLVKDYRALSVRATPRHIMRPLSDDGRRQCAAILKSIENSTRNGVFVVDAFTAAASEYSSDGETRSDGGKLGELIPQGTIRSKSLDRYCFTAELGAVEGPYESEFGWHLVLVEERLNCFKDQGMTKIEARPLVDGAGAGDERVRSVLVAGDDTERAMQDEALVKTLQTMGGAVLLSGVVAELAAAVGGAVEAFARSQGIGLS